MSDDEFEVLDTLGDEALQFLAEKSKEGKRLVFTLSTWCDASISLKDISVMFRGDDDVIQRVDRVALAVLDDRREVAAQVDLAEGDEEYDRRVMMFPAYRSQPLPLGGMNRRLCIVIHGSISPAHVKFEADVVATPEVYMTSRIRKRIGKTEGFIRFKNGMLTSIENPVDALEAVSFAIQGKLVFAEEEDIKPVKISWRQKLQSIELKYPLPRLQGAT